MPDRQLARAVGELLDDLEQPCLIFDRHGAPAFETRAFRTLLQCESDLLAVRRAAGVLAHQLPGALQSRAGPADDAVKEVTSRGARYSLRRQRLTLAADGQGAAHVVAVLVAATPVGRSVDEVLRCRFGLTSREVVITHFVADGLSASQIATQLGISVHTVRRHCEQVYRKLEVHTRAGVGALIRRVEAGIARPAEHAGGAA